MLTLAGIGGSIQVVSPKTVDVFIFTFHHSEFFLKVSSNHFSLPSVLFLLWVTKSRRFFCDPTDCRLPGASICGTFQARILAWVAASFSRRSSPTKEWICISYLTGRFFTSELPRKPKYLVSTLKKTYTSWSFQAVLAEHHRRGAYKQQTFISHSSRGWEVQDQSASRSGV